MIYVVFVFGKGWGVVGLAIEDFVVLLWVVVICNLFWFGERSFGLFVEKEIEIDFR